MPQPLTVTEQQAIAAGVLEDIVGLTVVVSTVNTPVAVYPTASTALEAYAQSHTLPTAHRASVVQIRTVAWSGNAAQDIHIRATRAAVTGDPSARLIGGVEYEFPLSPNVNTLNMIQESLGGKAIVRWIIRP